MKQITRLFIISTFCSISLSAAAQQAPTFGFTPYLLSVSNPAMTKSNTPVNVTLAGRKYWVGVPNSPDAFIGTFSLSQAEYKSAVGGYFWRENAPMISKQTIGVNYGYAVKNMDAGNNLRLGMGMDFISVSMNNSSILTYDYNDPFYTALVNNNKSSVDLRLGAVLNLSDFEVGLAMQQV
jgi:type IX secretion system PorP/SprF family membrane protein